MVKVEVIASPYVKPATTAGVDEPSKIVEHVELAKANGCIEELDEEAIGSREPP